MSETSVAWRARNVAMPRSWRGTQTDDFMQQAFPAPGAVRHLEVS